MQRLDASSITGAFPSRAGTAMAGCVTWVRRYGLGLVAYLGATWATDAQFMGDTGRYVNAILASKFWEFGHLLWYPLGWLASHLLMPFTRLLWGADARANVTITLMTLNWLAGLLSVFMVHSVVSKISKREWAANLAAVALVFSQGFLNFTQTGCAYVPGLALLLVGLYLSIRDGQQPGQSWRVGWPAGLALAFAVGLWFPYALALPAALVAPVILFGPDRRRWRFVSRTFVAFAVAITLVYSAGTIFNRVRAGAGLMEGVASPARYVLSITGIHGAPRMAFGLVRSFINVGNDGRVFKRFLVRDPTNPVSMSDLGRVTLAKLALFYLFVGWMVTTLARSERGKRIMRLLLLNGIPVIAFALVWQGGDMERYLPLYPVFFVSLVYSWGRDRSSLVSKGTVMVFVVALAVTNVGAMAKTVSESRQAQVLARIEDLAPLLRAHSMVATVNVQDELWAFHWTFPLHPINRAGALAVYEIIVPGTSEVLRWRQRFASEVFSTWAVGGDVWVSERVLSSRPQADWNWIEGDDRRVTWEDIHGFFSRLQAGRSVGRDDGFWLLVPSRGNMEFLGAPQER